MRYLALILALFGLLEAQAACVDVWKLTLEQNREKLAPASRRGPEPDNVFEEIKDTFLGLGESVSGILERSALVPRVRFQERTVRLLENNETADDLEVIRKEYIKRYSQINKSVLNKRLANIFIEPENLCKSSIEVISENEFYSLLHRKD